jgi:hypothetical protein
MLIPPTAAVHMLVCLNVFLKATYYRNFNGWNFKYLEDLF